MMEKYKREFISNIDILKSHGAIIHKHTFLITAQLWTIGVADPCNLGLVKLAIAKMGVKDA